MAKEINIDINFNTKDAQSDVKNFDKDLKGLGETSEDTSKKAKTAGKDVKAMGGGAKKSGEEAQKSSKGWNILGMAMRATGIGALVGIIFKFTDVLMGNQRVMDTVNIAAETMAIIFSDVVNWIIDANNTVIDFVSELGSMRDIFNNVKEKILDFGGMIKEYVIDSVKKTIEGLGLLGKSIGLVFQGKFGEAAKVAKEGVKTIWNANPVVDLTKKTIEYGKKAVEVVIEKTGELIEKGKEYYKTTRTQAKAIVKTRNAITKLIGTLEKEKVAIQKNIDIKTKERDNEHKTFEERKQAAQDLMKLENDMLKKDIELAKAKVENAEAELRVNADNLQMQQDLALAQVELEKLKDIDIQQTSEQAQAYHDLTVAQSKSLKEIEMLSKFGREREEEELDAHYKELLEKARIAGADEAKIKEHYEMKKTEIRRKYNNITLQAAGALFGALASAEEKGSKKWKKMAKAQALINTYLGVTTALRDKEMPFLARMLNAATQLVMGMANVKAITKTKMEGADDGGGGGDEGTGGVSLPIGQGGGFVGDFQEMIPNQLSEQISGTGATPVQAYVVENDISSSQALQEELNLQSTL